VFENAIDMAHIHYLHGDSFGNADAPQLHRMEVSALQRPLGLERSLAAAAGCARRPWLGVAAVVELRCTSAAGVLVAHPCRGPDVAARGSAAVSGTLVAQQHRAQVLHAPRPPL
jgi:hypothetical protein